MSWQDRDKELYRVFFSRTLSIKTDAIAELERWFTGARQQLSSGASELLEHIERRVVYFQEHFESQLQSSDYASLALRLTHTAAQAALLRTSADSLRLADAGLRNLRRIVEERRGAADNFDWSWLEHNKDSAAAPIPDEGFVRWLHTEGKSTLVDGAVLASDMLRVRSLSYSLYEAPELLQYADHDLSSALAILIPPDSPPRWPPWSPSPSPGSPRPSPSPTGGVHGVDVVTQTKSRPEPPQGTNENQPGTADKEHSYKSQNLAFVLSDPFIEADELDIVLAQRISLLREKALADLKLAKLAFRSKERPVALNYIQMSADAWNQIHQLTKSDGGREKFKAGFRFRALLLSLAEGAELHSAPSGLIEFYANMNWRSDYAKEGRTIISVLPYLKPTLLGPTLEIVLKGQGMTPLRWKEILRILLVTNRAGLRIQDLVANLMAAFSTGDPEKKDQYVSAWMEVLHETEVSRRLPAPDLQSEIESVLQAMRDLKQNHQSTFASGPSKKTVSACKDWLEQSVPACKAILRELLGNGGGQ